MVKRLCFSLSVFVLTVAAIPAWAQQFGWLGISIDDQRDAGAKVRMVEPNSPAEKAGIKAGDVVLAYNNEKVLGVQQLTRLIRETPVGRTVDVRLQRDGREQTVQVTTEAARAFDRLGNIEVNVPEIKTVMADAVRNMPRIEMNTTFVQSGIRVEQMTDQLRDFFGVRGGNGVLVASIEPGSVAEKAGLKPGDVITVVNGRDIRTPADFSREMRAQRGSVTFKIVRDRQERDLKLD